MLITLRAVKGFTGLTNQTVKILSLSMSSCSPDFCRLLSRGRARKKYDVEKGKSYEKYIFHCYFSFTFFLTVCCLYRCRSAFIVASDWFVLPI